LDGSHFDNQADAATHESEGLGHYGIAATAILALFFLGEPGRQALRNLRLDIVIITVCSPTRKRRTKTSALSFMAVSIMCFLRPYSVLMEHRDEPPVCWSGQSCPAPLRTGWLGSAWSSESRRLFLRHKPNVFWQTINAP